MNKNLHRLVFNPARGLRMAVQETASSCGKAQGATRSARRVEPAASAPLPELKSLLGALLVGMAGALSLVSAVHAQIVADPSAPGNQRPTVLTVPNGVPLVNIQTPSAAGVSRNTYIQFDVNGQGTILNNARTNAQTQLGGWVQANPWLAGGAARVILNEINSSNPSQLRGFVEVAGSRAEVVIANPAGVNINGGGFINASRATITTGTPVVNGGNLEGYVVQKGLVSISGAGLDSSRTDFTGIIARAVEVNAGIWAQELKVTTGANQVDVAQSAATPVAGTGAAPAFALDVSQLGGMYAGKITLVGTEAGVGVRNAGTLGASAGNVVVTVDGMLQNAGRIASSAATQLDASGGINNTVSGTIYSTADTSLSTRGNLSNAGLVAAQGNTALAATGAASEISSTAGAVLAAGLREDGTLVAAGSGTAALSVSATQNIAALGQNLSAGEQRLSAGNIDLAGSQNSADSLSLTASSGGINASSAVMAVTQGLTISTPGLLRTDAAKVSAGQLTVNANALSNVAGEIVQNDGSGTGAANFTIAGQLNNTLGMISAGGALNIKDPNAGSDPAVNAAGKTLAITNTGGTLIAGQALVIDAASLSSDGKVLSQGSLSAKLLGNHTHTAAAQFQAAGDASLETTGTLTNQGQLLSGQDLTLKAASLDNQAGAEIHGTAVRLIATDANTLTNRGLIDGVETVIEAVTLNNLGTGRIYGDHVAIGATTLNNLAEGGAAPVIAARNRLDIGATTINNAEHALLFSGGDMAIGGSLDGAKQATGQAATLNNGSATIEALGNLSINAVQINNTNNHFSTQVMPVSSEVITEFQGSGSGVRYLAGTPGLTIYNDESDHLATPDGGRYEAWSMYQYTRSISETVVMASDPGQILSGGNMTINATNVLNDNSRIIAGGTLTASIGTLTNTEVAGQRVITDSGTVYNYWRNRKRGRDDTGTSSAGYAPGGAVQGINLTPTVYRENTAPVGSGTSINARTLVSIGQGASVATGNPNTAVPNNSLFRINPNAAGNFLIETDPRFASYRQWLSSDYMLQQLSLDPTVTQKRLGDGFYEQKLIREQVAELTGRRFLDGYQSDEAQYQALMANSVTFAQQHQLRPGIALSAEQMAQLTSDIVWLVEREVTLADGSKVKALVPQVYVKVKDGDLTGDGALISASAVNLNLSGDVMNSGTIAGRTVVALNVQNVQNLAGRIRGTDVAVAATHDLNNIGGQIIAGDSLVATAGRDLNVTSTTSTQTGGTGNRTNIDRVAGLYVTNPGGTLVASAGRDINLVAAQILNDAPTAAGQPAGSTVVAAGRDLNLGTVTESSNNNIVWNANNFRKDSQSQEVGTSIQTAGNLQLSAGNDLSARAASVQAQGALTLTAGNDIKLLAGQNTHSVEENHQYTSKGFLSKKTTTTTATLDDTTAQVTSLKGNTVTVLAGNDAILEGTKIAAQGDALVFAGNQLIAAAAHDSHSQSSSTETYKRGLSLSFGAIGAQFGTRGGGRANTTDTTTARGAEITSAQGNTSLVASGTAFIEGARISAEQGTASISGANVIIQAAVNTSSTSTTDTERGAKINAIGFSNPSEGIGRKLQETKGLQETSLARSTLTGQDVSITATQGDLHMAGATVSTPGTLSLNAANGTIALDGQQTETVSSLQSLGKDLMYQKMRDKGSLQQSTEYNQFNAGLVQINAPRITAQIGSKDSAQQLAQQPGMDWVGQLMNDPALAGKVNWTTIEDASKNWDYKKQGLTPEGAAVVTIVVAFFTYGAAGTAGGAASTAVGGGTTGAVVGGAVTAGVSALASQAAVSLINNQGDIGKVLEELGSSESLKSLVTAMVTGGALAGLNLTPTGTPTPGGGAQTFMNQLGQNLKAGVARSLISTAINGGSLEDSLKASITNAFIDTAAAQGAEWIGGMKQAGTLDAFTHKLAHAIAGCAAGAARTGSDGCAAGAIGAAVGEMAAEGYGRRQDTVQFAALMSAIAAAVAGGNAEQINLASQAGANAAANNYLSEKQKSDRQKELTDCTDKFCKVAVSLKYLGISAQQDIGLVVGVGGGIGYQSAEVLSAAVELVAHLPETLTALKAIISDPEFRASAGAQIVDDYGRRIDMLTQAYNQAGWEGSVTAGVEGGRLAVDIVMMGSATIGLTQLGLKVASAGGTAVANAATTIAFRTAAAFDSLDAASQARWLTQTGTWRAATTELAQMELQAGSKAHPLLRHGDQVELSQLQTRALTGATPDGVAGRAVDSTRWLNNEDMLVAIRQAQARFAAGDYGSGTAARPAYEFSAGKIIGEGYYKATTKFERARTAAVFLDSNGLPVTAYPKLPTP